MKTVLLSGLGFLFLILGAIGLFLPVWPTTPFVLVSVACFSSSPRIKAQIMRMSFFREHIENYEKRNGLSKKTFRLSMGWLWGMLLLSMCVVGSKKFSILLFIIGFAVTAHILYMAKAGKKAENQ